MAKRLEALTLYEQMNQIRNRFGRSPFTFIVVNEYFPDMDVIRDIVKMHKKQRELLGLDIIDDNNPDNKTN